MILLIRNPENSELCCLSDLISSMNSWIWFSMWSSIDTDVMTWCLSSVTWSFNFYPKYYPLFNYLSWKKSSNANWSIYFIIWIIYDIPSWMVFRSTYCQIRTSRIHVFPLAIIFLVFLCEISRWIIVKYRTFLFENCPRYDQALKLLFLAVFE